jgi:hypothetical protein
MTLKLLSPLGGRYTDTTPPLLTKYFSEYAFLSKRVHVELDFVFAISKAGLVRRGCHKVNPKQLPERSAVAFIGFVRLVEIFYCSRTSY